MVQELGSGRGQLDRGMDMARYRDQGGCKILGRCRSLGGCNCLGMGGYLDRGMGWNRALGRDNTRHKPARDRSLGGEMGRGM